MTTMLWYPVRIYNGAETSIEMPEGAEVLHVHERQGEVCLWALVDTEREVETRRFVCAGTGHPIQHEVDIFSYIGTVHSAGIVMVYVWHIFEILGDD